MQRTIGGSLGNESLHHRDDPGIESFVGLPGRQKSSECDWGVMLEREQAKDGGVSYALFGTTRQLRVWWETDRLALRLELLPSLHVILVCHNRWILVRIRQKIGLNLRP